MHDMPVLDHAAEHQRPAVDSPHADLQILIDGLRAGRVVLCAGAALGKGQATWRGIVGRLLDELSKTPGNEESVKEARGLVASHPFSVCGFVRRRLGGDFPRALRSALPQGSGLSQAAQLASALPFRAIVTTSFEDELLRAVGESGTSYRVYRGDQAGDVFRDGRGRYIMRILGSVDDPEHIVFSESDLRTLMADESFRKLIGELHGKRSFLFVGFDPSDPDFGILVDRILVGAGNSTFTVGPEPQHFALLTGVPRVVQEEIEAAYGIKVLSLPGIDDELGLLRALRDAVGDHPGEILPDDNDLEGWLRVLQQEPSRTDALDKLAALEASLTAAGDADRLVELWLGRTEVESTPAGRARCLRRVAEILERDKGQIAEAFHSLLAAYKEAPEPELLDELERLAGVSGLWVDLLTALREAVPHVEAKQRPELWLRIAGLYGDKLNHIEYALASLGEAQKLEVSDSALRRRRAQLRVDLTRRGERWKELAEALGQLAAELPDGERERKLDLYLEQGELYDSRLSDGVSAVTAFKSARGAVPGNRDALAALEPLLRRMSDWPELIKLLDDKAALLDEAGETDAALRALREVAQLVTEHQNDKKAAVARWESLHKRLPTDVEILRALERLTAHEGGASEHYLGIVRALADNVPSDKERLTLYRRLVAEYEELPGHTAQAEECLEKIISIEPKAEDAYRGLERLYRQDKKWQQLLATYKRHAEGIENGRAEVLAALAKVHETDIPAGDAAELRTQAPAAIAAWEQVLAVSPEHLGALEALARLYPLVEGYDDAVRVLEKRARLIDDRTQKANLYFEAGRICQSRTFKLSAAEEHYVRALEIDPQHVQSIAALAELYRGQREYLRAAKLYTEAESHTQNRLDKCRYLVEAARQHLQVEEFPRALELFQQALKLDPEHAEAGAGAVEVLWRDSRFEEALPILEMLGRKEAEPRVQVTRLCRLGHAAATVGQRDKAQKAYQRAVDLDPGDLVALRGLIPLLSNAGQFVDAQKLCKKALAEHREELAPGERVELLSMLGAAELKLDHTEAGQEALREALALDPWHRASLLALLSTPDLAPDVQLSCKQSLLKGILNAQALGEGVPGVTNIADEKARLMMEIGDLLAGPLGEPQQAIASYKDGLLIKPESPTILHKLLEVYTALSQWPDALDVLDTLTTNEKQPRRRARFRLTSAIIARDHTKEQRRALTLFHAALDDDATLERALESIETLATELDDPKELLKAYQRQIKALGPDATDTPKQRAERLRLWTAISMLCIQRLADLPTGAAAYEVTVALDAQNLDRRRQMASIYTELGADHVEKAIAEHIHVLGRNKAELESYRALKELYLRSMQREKALAVASALHLLGKGDASDEALVSELRERPLRPASRPLSRELWRLLAHPDEEARLGSLFAQLLPSSQAGQAKPRRELALGQRIEPVAGQFYAKAARYCLEALDAPMPELYTLPDEPTLSEVAYRVRFAAPDNRPGALPATCVELGLPLISPRRPEREVTFEIARLGALLRPERAIRFVAGKSGSLGLMLDAALALSSGDNASGRVGEIAQGLRRALTPQGMEQVVRIGRSLLESYGAGKSESLVASWLVATDLTAARAGLLLAGDLEAAATLLATDPIDGTGPSAKQRLLELIYFSVTEECFTLRQHLGLLA